MLCTKEKYFIQDDLEESAERKACQFKRSWLGDCSGLQDPHYGYSRGRPCILLRMNRVSGLQAGKRETVCVGKKRCKFVKLIMLVPLVSPLIALLYCPLARPLLGLKLGLELGQLRPTLHSRSWLNDIFGSFQTDASMVPLILGSC